MLDVPGRPLFLSCKRNRTLPWPRVTVGKREDVSKQRLGNFSSAVLFKVHLIIPHNMTWKSMTNLLCLGKNTRYLWRCAYSSIHAESIALLIGLLGCENTYCLKIDEIGINQSLIKLLHSAFHSRDAAFFTCHVNSLSDVCLRFSPRVHDCLCQLSCKTISWCRCCMIRILHYRC